MHSSIRFMSVGCFRHWPGATPEIQTGMMTSLRRYNKLKEKNLQHRSNVNFNGVRGRFRSCLEAGD